MGQTITVTQSPSAQDNTVVLSTNRSLTGMEILTFTKETLPEKYDDPATRCADRIIKEGAASVTVYSNVVTITAEPARIAQVAKDATNILENLFIHYDENMG